MMSILIALTFASLQTQLGTVSSSKGSVYKQELLQQSFKMYLHFRERNPNTVWYHNMVSIFIQVHSLHCIKLDPFLSLTGSCVDCREKLFPMAQLQLTVSERNGSSSIDEQVQCKYSVLIHASLWHCPALLAQNFGFL